MTSEQATRYLKNSGMSIEQIQTVADAFAGEVVNVKQIVKGEEMTDAKHMIDEATYQELLLLEDILNEIVSVSWDEHTIGVMHDIIMHASRRASKLIEEECQRIEEAYK